MRLRGARRARARAALAAGAALTALCLGGHAHAGARGWQEQARGEFAARALPSGDVLAVARRWLGSGKMTPLPGPWCADFVSLVLRLAGHPPLAGRLAADALRYGTRVASPRPGDLVVMRTRRSLAGHVGIVEGLEGDGSVRIISGNWGRRVARAIVPRAQIVAFVEVR